MSGSRSGKVPFSQKHVVLHRLLQGSSRLRLDIRLGIDLLPPSQSSLRLWIRQTGISACPVHVRAHSDLRNGFTVGHSRNAKGKEERRNHRAIHRLQILAVHLVYGDQTCAS